jgi:hypothetical protein
MEFHFKKRKGISLSLFYSVYTGSVAQPVSYIMSRMFRLGKVARA